VVSPFISNNSFYNSYNGLYTPSYYGSNYGGGNYYYGGGYSGGYRYGRWGW
jgi:hypothetical protein